MRMTTTTTRRPKSFHSHAHMHHLSTTTCRFAGSITMAKRGAARFAGNLCSWAQCYVDASAAMIWSAPTWATILHCGRVSYFVDQTCCLHLSRLHF